MSDDLLKVLTRFHREIVVPDIERIVDERINGRLTPFRDEVMAAFDRQEVRFDRLEEKVTHLGSRR